ncbi:MAG: lysine--tRNA ligase [Rickettsiales bacterium]|jgi:lysyl-tRNA synthetase class 2|nr:lysine--tRNA ligase [Rickettsiales bacterium]
MTDQTKLSTNELTARLQKAENIKLRDGVVWKDKFNRTGTIAQTRELNDGDNVVVPGRITALRWLGKLMFGRIYDIDGEIQFSMSRDELGEDNYKFFKSNVDLGDFVGLTGELYHTTAGELTINVSAYEILGKALRPLPEKFHGLTDTETRYRQRYLDIIANAETRNTMLARFKMIRFIRNFLESAGFVEVETPILKPVSSGAAAKPFTTHHNALDTDLFLRIAPELALKECIAAGFDRVFELGKNFRNEGMDAMHLQEFTMLEWYAAYWDYNDNIDFSWKMVQDLVMEICGSLQIEFQGTALDFSRYEKIDYTAAMNELLGTDVLAFTDADSLKKHIAKIGLFPAGELDGLKSPFAVIDYVFKRKIRDKIIQPTITFNYPTFTRPLARRNDDDPRRVDNFQLIVMGAELINAYSELVDPIEQRKSFEEQMANKAAGDDESVDLDEDFMLAMEHGMPPISGLGFGFDRWVSLLTNQPTLRDVVLFPTMK